MWYVVRTRPLAVFEVKERMEQCGAQCYCPVVVRRARPGKVRKPREIEKPAFPGYFFIHQDDVEELSAMPHHRYQILRMGSEEYLAVSDAEIERLAEMERAWRAQENGSVLEHFSVGQKVKLKGASSADPFGVMEVVGNVGRYSVVELLGRRVKVDAQTLELAA